MGLIGTVARKEFLEVIRDGRFRMLGAVVIALLAGTLLAGWKTYSDLRKEREAAQAVSRQEWEAQPSRNPHTAAHYGVYAVKPPQPLSLLDRGIDAYAGAAVYLEAHYQNPVRYRSIEDAPAIARMGELTAASVLQLFVPLLLVVLMYSSLAGERESGTLRYLSGLGVPHHVLVIGKAVGNAAALATLIVPACIAGAAALTLSAGQVASGLVLHVAWLAAGYVIYHLGWIALSLGVSGLASSSGVALGILLVFWVTSSFVMPVAFADLADRLYPSISSEKFAEDVAKDIRQGLDGHDPASQRYEAGVAAILKQYGAAKVEDLPVNIEGLMYLESERYSDRVMDKHYGELWELHDSQRRVLRLGALVAPLIAIRSWSSAISGTDNFHHREFAAAAENYRRELVRRLNEDLAYNSTYEDTRTRAQPGGRDYRPSPELWASLPSFRYTPPPLDRVLSRELPSLGMVSVWLVIATGVLLLSCRHAAN
jgi:ABC-2 type transport system permease protein